VFSAGDFSTSFKSIYTIDNNVDTKIQHRIDLTNNQPNTFASEYALNIGAISITDIKAYDASGNLPLTTDRKQTSTTVKVNLEPRPVVGTGKTKSFTIEYQSPDVASYVGKILEVNTPRMSNANEFDTFEIILEVPIKYGSPSVIIPQPESITANSAKNILKFSGGRVSGISAVFGTSQIFKFDLDYYLENQASTKDTQAITLVPDTAYQQVTYEKITPGPDSYDVDSDGNWLAKYTLTPNQKLAIKITGSVETLMKPIINAVSAKPSDNLSPAQYWQSDDEEIVDLAKQLKTPQAIYDYVVEKLRYDYSKVENNGARLGAKLALSQPDKAICTEFTDLFIALARAAGIPAREMNGFAFTQNPKLRPLSLTKDILHAWPEYWDSTLARWIPIDPTWGNTTDGVDYFSKLDFNHVVFAIHGASSVSPLPAGFYKTNDFQGKTVAIEPAQTGVRPTSLLEIKLPLPESLPTYKKYKTTLTVTNWGNQAVYNLPLTLSLPQQFINSYPKQIKILLPFQTMEIPLTIKPISLFDSASFPLQVKIGTAVQNYELEFKSPVTKNQAVFVAISAAAVIFGLAAVISRRLYFQRQKP